MKNTPVKCIAQQSGNALWFVLIAVVLLGVLTAAVTRTSSSVEQTGGVEKARITAGNILRYSSGIETAVAKMLLSGTSESDLDFIAIGADFDNTNCATPNCDVFNIAGGGIAHRTAKQIIGRENVTDKNWVVTNTNRFGGSGCDDDTPPCADLALILQDIPDQVCVQINALQTANNAGSIIPVAAQVNTTPFTGDFSQTASTLIGAEGSAPELAGKNAGCAVDKANNTNTFYQVLLAR